MRLERHLSDRTIRNFVAKNYVRNNIIIILWIYISARRPGERGAAGVVALVPGPQEGSGPATVTIDPLFYLIFI